METETKASKQIDRRDRREYMKQYREAHKEHKAEYMRQYNEEHKERKAELAKEWYQRNKSRILEPCVCDVCGHTYVFKHKRRHEQSNPHKAAANP